MEVILRELPPQDLLTGGLKVEKKQRARDDQNQGSSNHINLNPILFILTPWREPSRRIWKPILSSAYEPLRRTKSITYPECRGASRNPLRTLQIRCRVSEIL